MTTRKLPHYTRKSVVELLNSKDPRIKLNDYGDYNCIQLSDEPGYFMFSDKDGGTATFYAETFEPKYKATPIFTASVDIPDEIRKAKCTARDCNCNSPWTNITHSCGCNRHHKGESYGYIPRIEVCNTTECDGQHGHLLGQCDECFSPTRRAPRNMHGYIHLMLR